MFYTTRVINHNKFTSGRTVLPFGTILVETSEKIKTAVIYEELMIVGFYDTELPSCRISYYITEYAGLRKMLVRDKHRLNNDIVYTYHPLSFRFRQDYLFLVKSYEVV